MNCCDEYGDCRQGRDCPVRTRRVRAGGPPPDDMPIQMMDDEPAERSDFAALAIVLGIAAAIAAIAWLIVEVMERAA